MFWHLQLLHSWLEEGSSSKEEGWHRHVLLESKWKVSPLPPTMHRISLVAILRVLHTLAPWSGNSGSQRLSEFASASYTLSVRQIHCAWRHRMQSLSHWISLVPSSTYFPHMAQRYYPVYIVLKAMKQYSQWGYNTNPMHCLLFRAMTSARSQEMTSHTLYIFELHLPRYVYGFHSIAAIDRRPSIVWYVIINLADMSWVECMWQYCKSHIHNI